MNNIIRLSACVNKIVVGNPETNAEEIIKVINEMPYHEGRSEILIFPRFALTSSSIGSLAYNKTLFSSCEKSLSIIRSHNNNHNGYLLVGTVVEDLGRPVSALALMHHDEMVALIPTSGNPKEFADKNLSAKFTNPESIISIGETRVKFHTSGFESISQGAVKAAGQGCDLLITSSYEPVTAGEIKKICELLSALTKSLGIAIAVVNGGAGDTSSPYFYHAFVAVYENGEQLAFDSSFSESFHKTVDLDLDIIRAGNQGTINTAPPDPIHKIAVLPKEGELLRTVHKNPFLPQNSWEREEYLEELFEYQVQSLVCRMRNVGITSLVLGVSGGIDSTAALLVAIAACDCLGLPRENIHGITMPGLGTSELTYYNALALLEQLGVSRRDISIRASVLQHFSDIGHQGKPDTTYENAQARERTQILLDIANQVGGLVVGSGDLSEEALGFATFGGDHLANYNVNSCMTKTMLRYVLGYIVESEKYPEVSYIIKEVLDTPVSPELLPPDETGEISQKTEDILGPYELHEFFLYYFIAYNMQPSKIYYYACVAFKSGYTPDFIKDKLNMFIKKFCANQFKRSCAPDASAVTNINLLGVRYAIPSDLRADILLDELNSEE